MTWALGCAAEKAWSKLIESHWTLILPLLSSTNTTTTTWLMFRLQSCQKKVKDQTILFGHCICICVCICIWLKGDQTKLVYLAISQLTPLGEVEPQYLTFLLFHRASPHVQAFWHFVSKYQYCTLLTLQTLTLSWSDPSAMLIMITTIIKAIIIMIRLKNRHISLCTQRHRSPQSWPVKGRLTPKYMSATPH